MPTIALQVMVRAPASRASDLARCVEFHVHSMRRTGELAVAGKATGLLSLGDEITWEGRHLGIRQRLTSRVCAFEPPHFFADEMVRGAFASFRHGHRFGALGDGLTRVSDLFTFGSPLGLLGRLTDAMFLTPYMRGVLTRRSETLKAVLEDGTWERFLGSGSAPSAAAEGSAPRVGTEREKHG